MNRDDIIRMAREAGYKHPDAVGDAEDFAYFDFERFAALVAAAEQKKFCNELAALHDRYSLQSNPKFLSARGP
jgi:hypothetical protein